MVILHVSCSALIGAGFGVQKRTSLEGDKARRGCCRHNNADPPPQVTLELARVACIAGYGLEDLRELLLLMLQRPRPSDTALVRPARVWRKRGWVLC